MANPIKKPEDGGINPPKAPKPEAPNPEAPKPEALKTPKSTRSTGSTSSGSLKGGPKLARSASTSSGFKPKKLRTGIAITGSWDNPENNKEGAEQVAKDYHLATVGYHIDPNITDKDFYDASHSGKKGKIKVKEMLNSGKIALNPDLDKTNEIREKIMKQGFAPKGWKPEDGTDVPEINPDSLGHVKETDKIYTDSHGIKWKKIPDKDGKNYGYSRIDAPHIVSNIPADTGAEPEEGWNSEPSNEDNERERASKLFGTDLSGGNNNGPRTEFESEEDEEQYYKTVPMEWEHWSSGQKDEWLINREEWYNRTHQESEEEEEAWREKYWQEAQEEMGDDNLDRDLYQEAISEAQDYADRVNIPAGDDLRPWIYKFYWRHKGVKPPKGPNPKFD